MTTRTLHPIIIVIKRIFFFYFFLFVLLVCVELSLFLLLVEEKVTTQGGRAHLCDWWKVANTRTPYLVCVQTLDELVDVFSYLKENQIIFFFYCQWKDRTLSNRIKQRRECLCVCVCVCNIHLDIHFSARQLAVVLFFFSFSLCVQVNNAATVWWERRPWKVQSEKKLKALDDLKKKREREKWWWWWGNLIRSFQGFV